MEDDLFLYASSAPFGITPGPGGTLWFTEQDGNRIGRISTTGQITEYTVPTNRSEPKGITESSNGEIWFTEYSGNKIGQLIP